MLRLKPMVQYQKPGHRQNRAEIIKRRLNEAFVRHTEKTSKALADHCGVTEQAVYKWRHSGKISRDNIPAVTSFFGEHRDWLLYDFTEIQEPESPYRIEISVRERVLIQTLRTLPTPVAESVESHILTLAKILARSNR